MSVRLNRPASVVLLLASAVLVRCSSVSVTQQGSCSQACATAATCGLLPSPLGGGSDGVGNCTQRCELTDLATGAPVISCLTSADVGSSQGSPSDLWCGAQPACATAASCLSPLGPGLVPLSTVSVAAYAGPLGAYDTGSCSPDASAPPSNEFTPPEAMTWCNPFTEVIPFIQQVTGYTFGASVPCSVALTQTTPFESQPAGAIRAGFEIFGTIPGDASVVRDAGAGSPRPQFCWVFHGDRVLAVSGMPVTIGVPISEAPPTSAPAECEHSETACSDGIDNDGDGAIDCQDLKCIVFSVCATHPVDAGREAAGAGVSRLDAGLAARDAG